MMKNYISKMQQDIKSGQRRRNVKSIFPSAMNSFKITRCFPIATRHSGQKQTRFRRFSSPKTAAKGSTSRFTRMQIMSLPVGQCQRTKNLQTTTMRRALPPLQGELCLSAVQARLPAYEEYEQRSQNYRDHADHRPILATSDFSRIRSKRETSTRTSSYQKIMLRSHHKRKYSVRQCCHRQTGDDCSNAVFKLSAETAVRTPEAKKNGVAAHDRPQVQHNLAVQNETKSDDAATAVLSRSRVYQFTPLMRDTASPSAVSRPMKKGKKSGLQAGRFRVDPLNPQRKSAEIYQKLFSDDGCHPSGAANSTAIEPKQTTSKKRSSIATPPPSAPSNLFRIKGMRPATTSSVSRPLAPTSPSATGPTSAARSNDVVVPIAADATLPSLVDHASSALSTSSKIDNRRRRRGGRRLLTTEASIREEESPQEACVLDNGGSKGGGRRRAPGSAANVKVPLVATPITISASSAAIRGGDNNEIERRARAKNLGDSSPSTQREAHYSRALSPLSLLGNQKYSEETTGDGRRIKGESQHAHGYGARRSPSPTTLSPEYYDTPPSHDVVFINDDTVDGINAGDGGGRMRQMAAIEEGSEEHDRWKFNLQDFSPSFRAAISPLTQGALGRDEAAPALAGPRIEEGRSRIPLHYSPASSVGGTAAATRYNPIELPRVNLDGQAEKILMNLTREAERLNYTEKPSKTFSFGQHLGKRTKNLFVEREKRMHHSAPKMNAAVFTSEHRKPKATAVKIPMIPAKIGLEPVREDVYPLSQKLEVPKSAVTDSSKMSGDSGGGGATRTLFQGGGGRGYLKRKKQNQTPFKFDSSSNIYHYSDVPRQQIPSNGLRGDGESNDGKEQTNRGRIARSSPVTTTDILRMARPTTADGLVQAMGSAGIPCRKDSSITNPGGNESNAALQRRQRQQRGSMSSASFSFDSSSSSVHQKDNAPHSLFPSRLAEAKDAMDARESKGAKTRAARALSSQARGPLSASFPDTKLSPPNTSSPQKHGTINELTSKLLASHPRASHRDSKSEHTRGKGPGKSKSSPSDRMRAQSHNTKRREEMKKKMVADGGFGIICGHTITREEEGAAKPKPSSPTALNLSSEATRQHLSDELNPRNAATATGKGERTPKAPRGHLLRKVWVSMSPKSSKRRTATSKSNSDTTIVASAAGSGDAETVARIDRGVKDGVGGGRGHYSNDNGIIGIQSVSLSHKTGGMRGRRPKALSSSTGDLRALQLRQKMQRRQQLQQHGSPHQLKTLLTATKLKDNSTEDNSFSGRSIYYRKAESMAGRANPAVEKRLGLKEVLRDQRQATEDALAGIAQAHAQRNTGRLASAASKSPGLTTGDLCYYRLAGQVERSFGVGRIGHPRTIGGGADRSDEKNARSNKERVKKTQRTVVVADITGRIETLGQRASRIQAKNRIHSSSGHGVRTDPDVLDGAAASTPGWRFAVKRPVSAAFAKLVGRRKDAERMSTPHIVAQGGWRILFCFRVAR
eukprot:jgi/Bigna1/80359/fgenesh1_pg.70_\